MVDDTGESGSLFAEDAPAGAIQRYRALVNAVDAGLYQLDTEGQFVAVNDVLVELSGYDRETLLGAPLGRVLAPGDVARVEAMVHSMAHDDAEATAIEVPLRAVGGTIVPCELQLSLLERDGEVAGTVGVVRDLRERETDGEAAARYCREESLVKDVLDGAGVGVVVRDADDTVVWINEATEAYFGVDRGEVIGAALPAVVDEHFAPAVADRERFVDAIEGRAEGDEGLDCQVLPGEGRRHRWLRHRSNPIETGQHAGGRVDVYHDVTEQKQSKRVARNREQQLTEERAFTDSLLDAQADLVYALDAEGRPIRWNDRVPAATGYSEAELAWMHALDLIAEPARERAAEALERVLEDGEQVTCELPLETKEGERIPYQFTGAPLSDDGEVVGLTGVGRDISTLRNQAERLERQRDELEAQLEEVFERVDDAVVAIDGDYRLTYLNDTAANLLQVDPAAALGADVRETDRWPPSVVDAIRVAYDCQRQRTVEAFYPALEAWVEHHVYPSETGVSVYFRDVTERERRKRELESQRERLAALDDLNGVVRDITDAVLGQSTREEIESVVVSALADSASYEGAWIAEPDPDAGTIHPRAEAGADPEALAVALDPGADENPIRRAAETRELQVAGAGADAEDLGAALERPRSAAAIPIVHEETLYGVLTVHAARADAFSAEEREVVGQLGEIVGHAIAALERKRALMSDEVTEVEFRIDDVFPDVDVPEPIGGIAFERTIPVGDDRYNVYGTATEAGYAALEALVECAGTVRSVRTLSRDDERRTFELRLSEPPLLSTIATHGGNVTDARVVDGDYHLTVQLPPGTPVRQLRDVVDGTYGRATFIAQRQVRRPADRTERVLSALTEELTERQRVVVETAYQMGYFEWPRASTGEKIAESLDIAPATFSQHLRNAHRRLFGVLLGDRDPPTE